MSSPSALLPPTTDPRWSALVKQGTRKPIKGLALSMILKRMNRDAAADLSPVNLKKQIDELALFFVHHQAMLAGDIATLFS